MRKLIKDTIITLLNPISPLFTLLIGWVLSLLISQPNDQFPSFINFMIVNPYVVLFFLAFWLIFAVIYTELQNRNSALKNDIALKEELIKEKDRQLSESTSIILNRSGDFANFNRLIRFENVLKNFTDNNALVDCIQMYNYSIKKIENIIDIKITYDSGYCSEGIDINNIAQCYYKLNYNDYNIVKNIIGIRKRLSSNEHITLVEKDALIQILINSMQDTYKKFNRELQAIQSITDVNDLHFTQYRILTLLASITKRKQVLVLDKSKILGSNRSKIEEYLLNGKRTGILNSILLEDVVMFNYTRNSHKKSGRAYVAFPVKISMQNYICVFSIQTSDLDKNVDLEYEVKTLKEDIIRRFEKK